MNIKEERENNKKHKHEQGKREGNAIQWRSFQKAEIEEGQKH